LSPYNPPTRPIPALSRAHEDLLVLLEPGVHTQAYNPQAVEPCVSQFVQGHSLGGIRLPMLAEEFAERDCWPPGELVDGVGDDVQFALGHLVQGAHPSLRLPFGHAGCAGNCNCVADVLVCIVDRRPRAPP